MKPLRVFYIVAIMLGLGLAGAFYYQYQLKDRELAQYQELSRLSSEGFTKVGAKLAQSKKELEKSLQEIARLNKDIKALKRDNLTFKSEFQALKEEREKLKTKIARLLEEKTVLEKKFHSLEELKKAIRIAKIEKRQSSKIKRMQRHLAKVEMLKALDKIALRQGNRGYLVRKRKSTFRPIRIRVELEPVNKASFK